MEVMNFDVLIIGAGPAGLATALRIKQQSNLDVCVLEKGAQVGAHTLSGAVIDPAPLTALEPAWVDEFEHTNVSSDEFVYLTKHSSYKLPVMGALKNQGNVIISLGALCQYLAQKCEASGVNVFPGFAADQAIIENGRVCGVLTKEMGRAKDGSEKSTFMASAEIRAPITVLAEGARGSVSESIIKQFDLRANSLPQSYGIGIKEIWRVPNSTPGRVVHTVGWPLGNSTYGGAFIYHLPERIALGMVVGLDYKNPYLSPFSELQRFKHHPFVADMLKGGECISYGARALNEGGFQSIPKLDFPGGILVGCAAGMLNVPRIKGTHNAIASGMLAAESIVESSEQAPKIYAEKFAQSAIVRELQSVRNVRPAFKWGLPVALAYSFVDQIVLRGAAPWTLKFGADYKELLTKDKVKKIEYPKPDNVLSFPLLTQLAKSGVFHEEDQPVHLVLKNPALAKSNYDKYDSPETRYCPAGVYEIATEGEFKLTINAQNCIHCKTCSIKDPEQNIDWRVPEGGGGPNYGGM